ncbi:LPS assembly lipoprotein LptE [Thermosulfurimonas dismutans]|uniref:Putative lipoprotein n=1 Tax=Thermosulfurimonas dismutans TaxID=999894 RepID=A0A179D6A4_9BACT|nr:LptE family protein [Thermosulfurimonas dismutans]OAQ21259.1 putative lipoprotein [Thermosulfurimonas dismutans]
MWRTSFLILVLFLNACGYRLREKPPGFRPEWQTLYVEIFKNRTAETELGVYLSEALRRRFARSGFVKLAASPTKADLVIGGEVKSLSVGGISYNTYTETLERRVSVTLAVDMRTRDGQIIWQNRNLSRYENYPVEGTSSGVLDPGKEEALRKLSEDLADIIYHQITASF